MDANTISHILLPIDFSESSLNAFETGVAIAQKNNASVTIIHVQDNTFEYDHTNLHGNHKIEDNFGDVLNALADAAQLKLGKVPRLIMGEGPITASIVNTANKYSCDLIVMGAHGASGYRELFIGTNTYKVIKYASCPVLIIPTKKKFKQFNNVLFPLKPLPGVLKKYDLIRCMTSNNQETSLEILCLSSKINDDDEQLFEYLLDEFKERTEGVPTKVSSQYSFGNNIAEIILKTAEELRSDLLLLTPSIDISNKQFFIGPYTQRILHHSKTPVLVIKRNN
ncbi:universal stress protein [Chitinophagaceae bacterium LB-8]|uniref:Universal stress protein n=1 Tax=Paraflavisolibacter caeni TaxID=2982496 RepID=A0A9X2XUI0_9BACT|nr:universal stress protein [Paraflavisolibacter caeni]MCU7549120.1 universal stress protein [Paraflavisolibacter caeni]